MKTLEQKQKEAAQRAIDRQGRSDQEQLKRLSQRPGSSAKEMARLQARINKPIQVVPEVPVVEASVENAQTQDPKPHRLSAKEVRARSKKGE
jgi:hypothetical protein